MDSKNGGTTENAVVTTPYLTVHLLNVILTGRTRVVVEVEYVATKENIVLVKIVQTTNFSKNGGNQMGH